MNMEKKITLNKEIFKIYNTNELILNLFENNIKNLEKYSNDNLFLLFNELWKNLSKFINNFSYIHLIIKNKYNIEEFLFILFNYIFIFLDKIKIQNQPILINKNLYEYLNKKFKKYSNYINLNFLCFDDKNKNYIITYIYNNYKYSFNSLLFFIYLNKETFYRLCKEKNFVINISKIIPNSKEKIIENEYLIIYKKILKFLNLTNSFNLINISNFRIKENKIYNENEQNILFNNLNLLNKLDYQIGISLDNEKYNDELYKSFICIFCKKFINPKNLFCEKCHIYSCEYCAKNNYLKCPKCSSNFNKIHLNISNILNNIEIKCPNQNCQQIIKYNNYWEHINYCNYSFFICSNKFCINKKNNNDSFFVGNKNEMIEHMKICFFSEFECEYCFKTLFLYKKEEHLKEKKIICKYCNNMIEHLNFKNHIIFCLNHNKIFLCYYCYNFYYELEEHNSINCKKNKLNRKLKININQKNNYKYLCVVIIILSIIIYFLI